MPQRRTIKQEGLEAAEKELQAIAAGAKRKRRWDVAESSDDKENQDVSAKPDTGEWSKEALDQAAPKKRRSRWDATPAETNGAVGETPKRSRWDQAPAPEAPQPMAQIIMNAPGIMGDDKKHNRYMTDEELDFLLPSEGYVIVPPPAGYTPLRAPIQPYVPPPEVAGFHMPEGSDAAAAAAAAFLSL